MKVGSAASPYAWAIMRAEAGGRRRGVGPPVGPSVARFAASNYLPDKSPSARSDKDAELRRKPTRSATPNVAAPRPATSFGRSGGGAAAPKEEVERCQRMEARMILSDLTRISMARLEDMKLLASLTGSEGPLPQHKPSIVEKLCLEAEFREEFRRMKELDLASRVEALPQLGLDFFVPREEADNLTLSLNMYNDYMDAVEQRKTYRAMLGSRSRWTSRKQTVLRTREQESKFTLVSQAYAPKRGGSKVPPLFGLHGPRPQARPRTAPTGGKSGGRGGTVSHRHDFLNKFEQSQKIVSVEVTQRMASVASPRISTSDALGVLDEFIKSGRRQFINAIVIARKLYRLECDTPAPVGAHGGSDETVHESIRQDMQDVLSTIEKSVVLARLRSSISARIIQAAWLRIVLKRKEDAAAIALVEHRQRIAAASIIQRRYRNFRDKQVAWNAAVEGMKVASCGARIARHWKMWKRRQTLLLHFGGRSVTNCAETQESRNRAAHEIGRVARGYIVRKRLRERQVHVQLHLSRKVRRDRVVSKFRESYLETMQRINDEIESICDETDERIAKLRNAAEVKAESFEESFAVYVHNGRLAAMKEPLPRNWLVQMSRDGILQYINTREGKIQLEHPIVQKFDSFIPIQRERGEQQVLQLFQLVEAEVKMIEATRQSLLDALFAQLQELRQKAQEVNAPAARGRSLYSVAALKLVE